MLIADPSSTCDICFENFSSSRECWCIPCGHIFCRQCLCRLTQFTCPVCRASLNNPRFPARKVHVDLSNCEGEISLGGAYHLKWLEQRLATKIQEGHRLDVLSAVDLFREVDRFLRTQSSNEYTLLRAIKSLLFQLVGSFGRVCEDIMMSQRSRVRYEAYIKQLEQSLKAHTRQLGRDDKRGKTRVDQESWAGRFHQSNFLIENNIRIPI